MRKGVIHFTLADKLRTGCNKIRCKFVISRCCTCFLTFSFIYLLYCSLRSFRLFWLFHLGCFARFGGFVSVVSLVMVILFFQVLVHAVSLASIDQKGSSHRTQQLTSTVTWKNRGLWMVHQILLQVDCNELPLNFVDKQFPLENNLYMNQSFQEWYSFDSVGFFTCKIYLIPFT